MKNTCFKNEISRSGGVGTQASAANDPQLVTASLDSRKRRSLNHWSSLSTLKRRRHKGVLIGIISRAGTPLLSSYVANTSLSRLMGLFAFAPLRATDALVLHPCSAVHTFGFKQALDVVFISKRGVILRCVAMKPNSMSLCWGAESVVEMAGGTVERLKLQLGQRLDIHLTEGCHE